MLCIQEGLSRGSLCDTRTLVSSVYIALELGQRDYIQTRFDCSQRSPCSGLNWTSKEVHKVIRGTGHEGHCLEAVNKYRT